jgi:hypothetical protein
MDTNELHILQKHLARFIIADVFNTISEDDILRIERSGSPTKSDVWHYKGDALQQAQVDLLKKQASSFINSELWKILSTELRYQALQKGLVKSQTAEDMIASKVLLYLTDVIDSKLKSMSQ